MAVNYAEKYSQKIDEKFVQQSMTAGLVNAEYDFVGVETVKVYSNGVSDINDYKKTGGARYGVADELSNEVQELKVAKDRSFTFTIDRGNHDDTMMTLEAGKSLARHLDQKMIPEIDRYRLSTIVTKAGTTVTEEITKDNAYESFLDASMVLTDKSVPLVDRVAVVSSSFFKKIKLDGSFIKASDIAQEMLIKGAVGQIDGINVIVVPESYLPAKTNFVITHKFAVVGVQKLAEYKVHENPVGVNGWLVEARFRYDAFVLDNKKDAIYAHMAP